MTKNYQLSAEEAGKYCGVSRTTFIKFSNLYPEELPRLEIKPGKKAVIRFCQQDVASFIRKRIANRNSQEHFLAEKLYEHLLMDLGAALHQLNPNADVSRSFFSLQLDMLLKAFMRIGAKDKLDDIQLILGDMEPHLSTELARYVGLESSGLARYATAKTLEYLLEWQVIEASKEQEQAIYKAVYDYQASII